MHVHNCVHYVIMLELHDYILDPLILLIPKRNNYLTNYQ